MLPDGGGMRGKGVRSAICHLGLCTEYEKTSSVQSPSGMKRPPDGGGMRGSMRVIHMDSGLGNQMLDYAEYLAIREANPDGDYYLETLIYDLPHMPGMFSQWNGYELERIFGIHVPNVRQLFTQEQWQRILERVSASHFWEEDWNYAPYIVEALWEEGLALQNMIGDRRPALQRPDDLKTKLRGSLTDFFGTAFGYHMKRYLRKALEKKIVEKENSETDVFRKYPQEVFTGHSLAFRFKGFGLDRIEDQVREAFRFPPFSDERNSELLERIRSVNSVAVHARRSDLLSVNGNCYRYGFFRRCVNYIRKHVPDPVFFFFCDEKSAGWCEENEGIFGLDFGKDEVHFVSWNTGTESYRDMQLMAECRHNIFTQSSFGFWGAWLNRNPDKITCAPDPLFLSTNSF